MMTKAKLEVLLIAAAAGSFGIASAQGQGYSVEPAIDAVTITDSAGKVAAVYRLTPPDGTAVRSGGFFHPVATPSGVRVTDLAPDDHPHHRGVFLAFVEMHGEKDADFWGWGEHAPTEGRRIANQAVEDIEASSGGASFTARNDWLADETVLVRETLEARLSDHHGLRVLDLAYKLAPQSDITLSQWAFSGFCLRVRKDAEVIGIFSPEGKSDRPAPSHVKPESDWPEAAWYAFEQKLADGRVIGAAVMSHPANPPELWHNHPDIRMLNPCIVAPAEVELKKDSPLTLRYRVVTFDGPVPSEKLDALAKES